MKPSLPHRALTTLLPVLPAMCLALMALPAASETATPTTATIASTAAGATAAPAGITATTQVEGITEYRLPNGLQILLVPDASKPTTTVNLTYRVGSRQENYGETGMAHLLEHLVFKGTPTTPNALAEFGRRGMRVNGTTWVDRTNYYASFAASDEQLRWMLSWQADAMVNSFIAKKDLDSEMTVVRNEMEAGENNPGRVLVERTLAAMYQWHNYGKSTIGARSDVENVDISRLQAFYRQWYQPDNATLIVAGRFDPAQVLAWVQESFGPIPRPARSLPPTYTLDPPQDGERQVTVRRVGGAPMLMMAHHVPPASHPDHAAIELLGRVLGDTPGGRLHKALVEKKLAAGTFAFDLPFAEPGPFFAGAQLAPGQSMPAARAAMTAVLDGLVRSPVTTEELERARVQWLNGWEQAYTDPETVGVMLSEAIALGDWRLFFLRRDEIKRLTQADLQRVATVWLKPDNRTVAVYEPTANPQRAPAPARVDVAALLQGFQGQAQAAAVESFDTRPSALDARTERLQLAGGLKLALMPKGTRGNAVRGMLALHWGDVVSLRGQGVHAEFMGALLDKGVDKGVGSGPAGEPALNRQQLADRFDALRAQVGFNASGQTLYVQWQTTRENAPAVLALIGRVLRSPALPAPALDELRAQWLASLAQQRDDPGAVVGNALGRHGNPYPAGDLRHVQTFAEQEASVRAVTLVGVRNFHRRFVSAASGELALVGDFDAAAVRSAAVAAFGNWRAPTAGAALAVPYARAPQPLVALPPTRLVLATPDKANANGRFVLPLALNDSHADAMALGLANHMFGGSLSSRLWMRIREKEGLSYGVNTGLAWNEFEAHSRLVGSVIFAPSNLTKVETALKEEFARSLQDGFTADELSRARSAWLNERQLARAQDDGLTSQLASQLYLDRRFALSQQRDERIQSLTLDEVNAAWRRWVDPSKIVWAWGGDFRPVP